MFLSFLGVILFPPKSIQQYFEDQKVFDLLSSGNTVGLFQVESAGMREALVQMKPNHIEDIIALVALYRPGPMSNIPTYNDCKHGRQTPDYLHPLLEDILCEVIASSISN